MKLSLLLGPKRLHRQHALAQQLETGLIAGAMVLHLLDVPTPTDRKNEPAAGKLVEARNRFGGDDRVSLRHEGNARPDLESARRCRGERQCDERIVGMGIALRQLAAARIR